MNLTTVLEEQILPRVEKPSRYLGNEVNAVNKPLDDVEIRIALAFPDLYDLGLGNLGIHILYSVINKLPWASCERVYAPALDMEQQLRQRGLKLFGLESRDELDAFDGIGITLQSELTYTNILNILDLAGLPLRTADRSDTDPLTFAGGPAVFNPEPIAPFFDFFVIGDGEDIVVEIAGVMRAMKGKGRKATLLALSGIEGIYVPALYPFETMADGRVLPREDAPKIRKRLVKDLNGAEFPTDYIVPYTQQVHDRISLEVLRGCTQGCRFCQAGMVTRPVRERKLEKVDELLEKTLETTGYEEVSLVSLSTCDYSRVRQLVENTVQRARPNKVAVSLPSLRLDSFSVELSDMVAETRKSGVTFAPEAASPRLRAVINKWIPDEELLEMSAQVYSKGWDHVKLYFMIGLPTERDDDIEAIADLCARTLEVGKSHNHRARVNLGVSTFVPKPFTPFQWARQATVDETIRKQDLLEARFRPYGGKIKFGRHDPEETFIEGLVTRADRRAADLIECAYRKGARFDAWREHLRYDLWLEAIADTGYDVDDALRERDLDERLPWDHIDVFIPKGWFKADWERATELKHAPDCRHRKCHKCGVIDEERELCASMLRDHVKARPVEASWTRSDIAERVEPEPVQQMWFRLRREGGARFLSHLESQSAIVRALRRARAPLAYSQGFHPHPKVSFSAAMRVGESSTGEYMSVMFTERIDPEDLRARLNSTMPPGFSADAVTEVQLHSKALMALNQGGHYRIELPRDSVADVSERVAELMARAEIPVERRGKTRKKKSNGRRRGRDQRRAKVMRTIDIRPMIREMTVIDGDVPAVEVMLVNVEGRPGKPRELLPMLASDPDSTRVLKRDTLKVSGEGWESISAGW